MIQELCQQIVDKLNETEYSVEFTAVRSYSPQYRLEKMQGVKVDVVFAAAVPAEGTRDRNTYDYFVDIGIQSKLQTKSTEEADPLIALAEAIDDTFRLQCLPTTPESTCLRVTYKVPYDPEEIREHRRFLCVLTLVFRVLR